MKHLKTRIQRELRTVYSGYVETIITSPADEKDKDFRDMKRFWSFIKHKKMNRLGVPSLKKGDRTYSHPKFKADMLNDHFRSVFTRDEVVKMCDLPPLPLTYPVMEDVIITREGVKKFLRGLKVHKAPGPDGNNT